MRLADQIKARLGAFTPNQPAVSDVPPPDVPINMPYQPQAFPDRAIQEKRKFPLEISDVPDNRDTAEIEAQTYALVRRFWMQAYFPATGATAGPIEIGFIPTDVWGFLENVNLMSQIAGGTPEQIIATDPNDAFSSQVFYTTSKRGTFQFGNDPGLMVAPGNRLWLFGTGLAGGDVLRLRMQVALKVPIYHPLDPGFAEDSDADITEALAVSE